MKILSALLSIADSDFEPTCLLLAEALNALGGGHVCVFVEGKCRGVVVVRFKEVGIIALCAKRRESWFSHLRPGGWSVGLKYCRSIIGSLYLNAEPHPSTMTTTTAMSRKGVGLAAFDRSRITSAQYASHGNSLRSSHSTSLATQLSVFRSLLQQFAQTHAKDIRSNPSFRAEFARMCSAIGVDPLSSSNGAGGKDGGSFWSQLLGTSVNDFYFELAVRVVEVCGATREENGGLIGVKEVRDRIMKTRVEGSTEITE